MSAPKVIIIGSGFSGLSSACYLAQAGAEVTVLEKHDQPGGRARQWKEAGFTFDMGPSWYWMPEIFDQFFAAFGKQTSDYYELLRLDPSYRIYWPEGPEDIPADFNALLAFFERLEPGSAPRLKQYLEGARYKYETGMGQLVQQPGRSVREFAQPSLLRGLLKLQVFGSARRHIRKYFREPRLQQLLEFPLLFLGALPEKTPALYSLMNYADLKLGTWYPMGGMYRIVQAMQELALSLGVRFQFEQNATGIPVVQGRASGVRTSKGFFPADVVLGSADYQFIESSLLEPVHRSYTQRYWESRVMAPSSLLYFIGLNRKVPGLQHHTLFFDLPFDPHAIDIYSKPSWPRDPLFYVSCTSKTDAQAAPEGCENLFVLIPVAPGLKEDEGTRDHYFRMVMQRMEQHTGTALLPHVIYQKSYAPADFAADYNAFKGNAYGLANTLRQTAIFKPSIQSRKVENLFYTGQLTVPGPGVPPSILSGGIAAREVMKYLQGAGRMSPTHRTA